MTTSRISKLSCNMQLLIFSFITHAEFCRTKILSKEFPSKECENRLIDKYSSQEQKEQPSMFFDEQFFHAIKSEQMATIKKLMRDETAHTISAVHFATFYDKINVLRLLLVLNGTSINATDCCGHTALHVAADRGNETVVDLLLKHRASPSIGATDNGFARPIHLASEKGHATIVKKLIAAKANCNATLHHEDGVVDALHLAVRGEHTDIIQTLIDAKADLSSRDENTTIKIAAHYPGKIFVPIVENTNAISPPSHKSRCVLQ